MTSLKCWTPVAKKCVPNKCVNCYENTFVFDKTKTEGKNGTLYISISDDECKEPCPLYTSLYLPKCASICLTKGKIYNFSYVDDSSEENPPTKVFYQTGTIIEPKTCIGTTLINPEFTTDGNTIDAIIGTKDDVNAELLNVCSSYNDLRDILRDN